jgi:hypoxanthine phosphoribosyltransferase
MTILLDNIKINDLEFSPFLTHFDILERIRELAIKINQDYEDKDPIFVAVLNGSFMFASDLMKMVDLKSELTFIKVNSYEGTESTSVIKEVIGINKDISGRHVIIIEDIVDTGHTIDHIISELDKKNPQSIQTVTLFSKPTVHKNSTYLKYVGFDIPNKFIVGYGLDYDGYGRNYQDVYQLAD